LILGRRAIGVSQGKLDLDDGTSLPFDLLLVAVGRKPDFSGLGLDAIGIDTDGALERQSRAPWRHIRFVGDAAGDAQFTHFAGHSGAIAAINALSAPFGRLNVDPVLPRVTFTDPEIASVGLTQEQARAKGLDVEVVHYDLRELDRAVIDGVKEGFIKLILKRNSDRVLGVTIAGPRAGELIMPWVLGIKQGIGLKRMLATIFPYPTYSEASRAAAGEWRRSHKPQWLLTLAERLLRWRRGG
jgi:pyruvate/2-oxoglutarate dehydrogenase complex dihydrolipoamide dehydrogenase (E3) component